MSMNQELKKEIKIYSNDCDLKKAIRQKCTDENLDHYSCPYANECHETCEFCLEEEKKINEKLLKGLIAAGLAVSFIGLSALALNEFVIEEESSTISENRGF